MLSLKCVEYLDLSYNELSENDLMKSLCSLDARVLNTLNYKEIRGKPY